MNPDLLSMFRPAADSSIVVPTSSHHAGKAVDWNAVILDVIPHHSIGPSDFEKEFLHDMATVGSLPFTTRVADGITTYSPVGTASTTASTSSVPEPAMNIDSIMGAMKAVLGEGRMQKIIDEAIGDAAEEERLIKKSAHVSTNPDFASW